MIDYDFKILQPSEFECFSRDLLQARENIFIESFADGRDKGIDLRFAYSINKTCIVQCKRYKDWKELKAKLKDEAEKVKRLEPQRYILTTSVDLTVSQKDEVVTSRKLGNIGHAVGHLAADGVETLKLCLRRYVLLDIENDAVELVERLGGL